MTTMNGFRRYPDRLTQREIIRLIRDGIYVIDPIAATIGRGGKEATPVEDEHGRLYVRLYYEGKRKSITIARLVWLSQTLQPIPKDFEIHHRDEDKRNNRWGNLLCLHKLDHRKLHSDDGTFIPEEIPF